MTAGDGGVVPPELELLAGELGLVGSYWDVRGRQHVAGTDALVAVCRAAGAELEGAGGAAEARQLLVRERLRDGLDPVAVAWDGAAPTLGWWLQAGAEGRAEVRLRGEGGQVHRFEVEVADQPVVSHDEVPGWGQRRLALPPGLEVGRWELVVEHGQHRWASTVLSAPARLPTPAPWERTWGVFAPLHALSGAGPVERGPSVADLDRLGSWLHGHGGQVVATLPLLASYLGGSGDTSPYDPVSRRFWNELYLDLDHLPGVSAGHPPANLWRDGTAWGAIPPQVGGGGAGGGRDRDFDHAGRAAHVRARVEAALAELGEGLDDLPAYQAFLAEVPEVRGYAAFRAAVERHGRTWRAWPERLRAGDLVAGDLERGDYDEGEARYHRYVQWALHDQLDEVAGRLASRGQRLYLDVPVGSSGDGYDTWRYPGLFGWGAEAGAPPDDFFEHGQRWGFPPLSPRASRRDGHRFVAACLRAQARVAGMVRLDHVMQLERVFWVPEGMAATDGVYVRYPREELLATVSIEAHRAGTVVVGEDLGTVPDEVREAMGRHGMLRTYVLQFAVDGGGGGVMAPPQDCVAGLGTHDTPTFTAWLRGDDVELERSLGLVDDERAAEIRGARQGQRVGLGRALAERTGRPELADVADDAAVVRASLELLAASEAATVLVALEDLWGEVEPQNVPGTGPERPNWVRCWPHSLDEAAGDHGLAAALDDIQAARLGAYERARASGAQR